MINETVRLVLDTVKTASDVATAKRSADISLRQGEARAVEIVAEINRSGKPLDLTGCEVHAKLLRADYRAVIGNASIESPTAGIVRYVLPAEASAVPCDAALMYFEVWDDDGVICATKPVGLAVGRGIDITAEQAEAYVTEFERLKELFRGDLAAIEQQKADQQESWQAQTGKQQADWQAQTDAQQSDWRAQSDAQQAGFEAAQTDRADDYAAAEAVRDEHQAKNNADQAINNAAMKKLEPYVCGAGEYDPDTLMPTIQGEANRLYYVPAEQGPGNKYVEWMLIEGAWEMMGVSQVEVSAITTGEIDAVAAGDAPTGTSLLSLAGLSYLWAKLKAAFAAVSHKHSGADITDNSIAGSKLASGAVTDAKVSANAAISGSKLADGSITAPKLGDKMIPTYTVSSETEPVSVTPCLRIVVDESGNMQQMLFDSGGGS